MKTVLAFIFFVIIFTGCGSSSSDDGGGDNGGDNTPPNEAPLVIDSNISVSLMEYSSKDVILASNVTDPDGDLLTMMDIKQVDGSPLPAEYSVSESILTIDATNFNVADGVDYHVDLNVTMTDGEYNVSYVINSSIQDLANDAILTATSITADSEVISGNDLDISLDVADDDGIVTVSYDLYFQFVSGSDTVGLTLVESGSLSDILAIGSYSATLATSGLEDGNYSVIVDAVGVIGGENPDSNATRGHAFSIYSDTPTTVGAPTLDSKTDTTINTTVGTFTDDDGVESVTVELYSDVELTNMLNINVTGDFSGLTADTTYYAVTTGEAYNALTSSWEVKSSTALAVTTNLTPDAPTTVGAPTLDSKTDTTINTTIGTFTDDDGVQNVTVELYDDSGLNTLLTSATNGDFTGLDADTTYYIVTAGEAYNAETSVWEDKTSSVLAVTTNLTPDAPTTVTAPTLDSKTDTTINTTIGTFTDDDGVRNVTVELYSDSGLNTLVDSATNGDFTGLSADTTYYAITTGEALNAETSVWESKSSTALAVTTDSPPVNQAPTWTQAEYSGNDIGDHIDDPQELLDLDGKASDLEGDTLTYAYVEVVSVPDEIDRSIWDNANFYISNGKAYVSGLLTSNPGISGEVVIKISVSDGVSTSFTNIRILFHNV